MKTFIILLCSIGIASAQTLSVNTNTAPTNTAYAVIGQGANQRVWQRTTYETDPSGQVIPHIHQYMELATGLNHLVNGQWVASTEKIDIAADGNSALATNGQHQAYFPGNIYSGEIELATPDGKQLYSQPAALSYFDGTNSVMIGELTNSTGEILPDGNQVIYTNAFAGLDADLLYTYTRDGFEQDVILREQPPDPGSLGLNPPTTRLQVLTEFFNPPQPGIATNELPAQAGMTLSDEELNFGVMQMVPGRAFLIGADTPSAVVDKQWVTLAGQQFLVEEVPIESIASEIDTLPQAVARSGAGTTKRIASKGLIVPPQRLTGMTTGKTPFLTQVKPASRRGLVLDYQTINGSVTNVTFQCDTTYYLSGNLDLWGTNTFEGGAVIKYTNGAGMTLGSGGGGPSVGINWLGDSYRPVILTAKDDDSVGDSISNSTGNPTNYYANPALKINTLNATLTGFRIAYAQQAISLFDSGSSFYDGQIVNCMNGISVSPGAAYLRNILFANVLTNLNSIADTSTLDVQNSTFSGSYYLITEMDENVFHFTNCVLVNVTNLYDGTPLVFTAGYNGFYNCTNFGSNVVFNSSYPFQSAGAGDYYLTNGCGFFNAGTTNIDSALLDDLGQETVSPPMVYSGVTITNNLTLNPQAQRDNYGNPDLGYHYDPIDYILDDYSITNATLTLTNGAAVASYNEYGVELLAGSSIVSIGGPLYPNWFVRYSSVQEQAKLLGSSWPYVAYDVWPDSTSVEPTGQYQFTKFACPAGGGQHLYHGESANSYTNLLVQECEFWSGVNYFGGSTNTVATLDNNLFVRSVFSSPFPPPSSAYILLTNNLFWGLSSVVFQSPHLPGYYVYDNAFDSCSNLSSNAHLAGSGYNAYLSCTSGLYPTNASDIFTNALAYETGPLGTFYQPTNSPLIHMGSTNANLLGLYHYTVTTNEVIEGTNIVSIGYHYVATTNGVPLDSNGDGVPDYLEDANGNGLVDSGEINWTNAGDLGLNVIITRPRNGSILP
jgi:hypothetical protein